MSAFEQPTTDTIEAAQVQRDWGQIMHRVDRDRARVVVEQDGKPVAAVIPVSDLARLQSLDDREAEAREVLQASWDAFAEEPPEQVEQRVARAVSAARARERRRQARRADS